MILYEPGKKFPEVPEDRQFLFKWVNLPFDFQEDEMGYRHPYRILPGALIANEHIYFLYIW